MDTPSLQEIAGMQQHQEEIEAIRVALNTAMHEFSHAEVIKGTLIPSKRHRPFYRVCVSLRDKMGRFYHVWREENGWQVKHVPLRRWSA